MRKENFTIGVLGGMGTYATIEFFKQYAEVFSANKEWERPRIIIDNRCTMPSRVRAYLYNENKDQLINEMSESIRYLIRMGGEFVKIVLLCNTSYLFLEDIYEKIPEAEGKIINLIEETVIRVKEDNIKDIYILGSEGTIDSGIYTNKLEQYGINCMTPCNNEYKKLRMCIEAIKQNCIEDSVIDIFSEFIYKHENILLGCTELPILYNYCNIADSNKKIYNPAKIVINRLKKIYCNSSSRI